MKREFLKELGIESKEVVDKIMEENGKDIEAAKGKKDDMEVELKDLKAENEKLNDSLKERDKQLETLKKSAGDNEDLKKQIDELKADNKKAEDAHKAEMTELNKTHKIESAILAANGKAIKAIMPYIDASKVSMDGDNLIGLNEQIESLKEAEDTKFLFESGTTKMKGAETGKSGSDTSESEDYTKKDILKMSLIERSNFKREHPNEYESIMNTGDKE